MANDIVTISEADAYLDGVEAWVEVSATVKQRLLDIAAGRLLAEAIWTTETGTYPTEADEPIEALKNAVCEIAILGIDDITVITGVRLDADLKLSRQKLGALETETEYHERTRRPTKVFNLCPYAKALLDDYIDNGSLYIKRA